MSFGLPPSREPQALVMYPFSDEEIIDFPGFVHAHLDECLPAPVLSLLACYIRSIKQICILNRLPTNLYLYLTELQDMANLININICRS